MFVHVVHDLGQDPLIEAFGPLTVACGRELREAHEVVRPESESDLCPQCLSITRRNRFQNYRCAVEMSPTAEE